MFSFLGAWGQVEIRLLNSSSTPVDLESMSYLEIHSSASAGVPVYLRYEVIADDGDPLYNGKSALFTLAPGTNAIRPGDIPIQHIKYPMESLEGSYLLCVHLITQQNEQLLTQICQPQQFTVSAKEESAAEDGKQKKSSNIEFSGSMRLTGQLSNQYFPFQQIPTNYLRWEFSPTLTIKEIPIQGRMFLSTEKNSLRYDLNTASFNLDKNQLQENLRKVATEKFQQEVQKRKAGLPFDEDFLNQVEGVRNSSLQKLRSKLGEFSDLSEEEALQSLNELERIEQILDHEAFDDVDKSWEQWQEKIPSLGSEQDNKIKDSLCLVDAEACSELNQLMSRKEELDKLKARRDSLKQLEKKLRKYEDELQALSKLKDDQTMLQDPALVKQLPIFSKAQKLLSNIETLGIGVTFPRYSPFLLDGISLKGADIAMSPGKLFVALSGGEIGRSFLSYDTLFPQPKGKLFATRIGMGNKEGNYVHGSLIRFISDSLEIPANSQAAPWVYGLESQWFFANKKWRVQGEWAQAATTPQSDAWKVETEGYLFNGKTRVSGHYQKVMPGYYSAGAPLLIADQERSEIQVDQRLMKGKMTVSGYYRKFQDVPFLYKLNQSTVQSAGVRLLLNMKKWPSIQLDIAPFYQRQQQADSLLSRQYQGLITAQIGHNYQLGGMRGNSRLMYSQQIGRSSINGGDFSAFLLTFSQLLSFENPFSFQATATYLHSDYSVDYNETLSIDVSGNATLFKKWDNGIGGTYLNETGADGLNRKGVYAYSRFPITQQLFLDLRLERSQYKNFGPEKANRNEYLIRGGINFQW